MLDQPFCSVCMFFFIHCYVLNLILRSIVMFSKGFHHRLINDLLVVTIPYVDEGSLLQYFLTSYPSETSV